MNLKKANPVCVCMSIVGAVALAGCGDVAPAGDKPAQANPDAYNNEPVTLTFYSHNAGVLADADLDALITRPIQAKFPNITPKLVSGPNIKLDTLIAAGEVPDVILTSNYYLLDLLQLGLGSDLNDFIKRENIDFTKFEPETIRVMKSFGEKGEFYGIPYAMNYGVLLYNKDIFDKFAVPYPKDGMTWSQVIELARKVTKQDQGVQYIGLDLQNPTLLTRPYGLGVVDEKQEKAVLTTDDYKRVFGIYEQNYSIPGSVEPGKKYSFGIDYFLKDQKTAMFPYWHSAITARLPQLKETGKDFNWDIVSFPSFDDKPGLGREVDFHLAMVTPNSKNKQAAYAVIKTMVSEEFQRAMNRGTRITVLNDPALKKEVSVDTKLYEGKNLQGMFAVKPAPLPKATKYDVKLYPFLNEAAKNMAYEKKDINSVLREAEEKANKYIQENK
ncbi:ABC transporter substrate-binding protein [Paenibacillus hamazuiensis]|uniref:ABC transporter substrate-binding protein n=1 Tax=Paenibacillus hamazuiensis TaxID=2936508 RepID=UPI00200D3DB1|nr:extracellular solute-binding protein [Paenibacillus hamazuiensis]